MWNSITITARIRDLDIWHRTRLKMNTTVKIKLWLHLNRHNHSLLFYRLRYESKTLGTKYRKHSKWWRWWESNPRPRVFPKNFLRAQPPDKISLARRQNGKLGARYPVDTLTLPGDHARGPCMVDAGFSDCRWSEADARGWTMQPVRNCCLF